MSTETATRSAVYVTSSTSGSLPAVTEADPSDRPSDPEASGAGSGAEVPVTAGQADAGEASDRSGQQVEPRQAERLTGAIYGTIVAAAVVAAASGPKASDGHILAAMLTTAVVFWLAHVFSRILAESMAEGRRLSNDERMRIAREEWPMLTACVPLAIPLLLGIVGLIPESMASWVSIAVAVLMLGAWGFRIGELEQRGHGRSFRLSLWTAAFGLIIVLLKVAVNH